MQLNFRLNIPDDFVFNPLMILPDDNNENENYKAVRIHK